MTTATLAPDETPPAAAEPGVGRISGGRIVALAILVAVLPMAVAAVRAVIDHWQPLSDNGITAVRALDVFSSHFPLLGYGSSVSSVLPRPVNHPGPLQFILLAPPVALFGPAAGLAIGTATVNAGAVAIAGWAAWRRAGTLGGVLAAFVAATLAWSMGSALLIDPWAPHALILPLFASCVLAWAVADGDLPLLPLAVGVASLAVQTHLSVVYLGPGLLIVATAWGWRRRGRAALRWIGIAALVGVVLWTPPFVEQVTTEHGNISRLVDEARHPPGGLVGSRDAVRVTAAVAAVPPFWFRDSMRTTLRPSGGSLLATARDVNELHVPSTTAAVLELAVLIGLLALSGGAAVRRRDRTVVTLTVVAGSALVLAWYTTAQVTTHIIGVSSHTFRVLWPVAAFVTFAIALGAVRALRSRSAQTVVAMLAAGTLIISVANLPASATSGGAQVDEWAMPVLRSLDRQFGRVAPDAPLLADWPGLAFGEPWSASFTAELRRRDIPFVVRDAYLVRQYGPARRYNGHNARSQVFYRHGPSARSATIGPFRRFAFHDGADPTDRRAYQRRSAVLRNALVRGDIRATPALGDANRAGLFLDLAGPFSDPAMASRALESRVLDSAWKRGLVTVPPRLRRELAEFARLQDRIDRATVGVYVGPIDARVP